AVIERERYTEEQQAVLHGGGPQTEIEYRLAWSRTQLKGMGLLENSARGVWSVTERGRAAREEELPGLYAHYRTGLRERRRERAHETEAADEGNGADANWKD